MMTGIKRDRSYSPANEQRSLSSSYASSSPVSLVNQGPSSSSEPDLMATSSTAYFEDGHIPPPPKSQKLQMSASEILFQSNSVAALKEIEPDLDFVITKKEQPPLPPTFTASVTVRGQTFEAENTQPAGARARAAQLVLYYLMLKNDPALKCLNVLSDNEANPFIHFTENPLNAFILIKPGVKINIIRAVGNPPVQEFTARVVIDATKSFEGTGPSKRAAQNEAARNALSSLISYELDCHTPTSSTAAAIIENPISGLMSLKPGAQIDIIKQEGKCPNIVFTARVVLNGRGYFGTGRRKQEAKKEAARQALASLTVQDQPENEPEIIQEKIDKLERVQLNIKRRLTSLQIQTQSKADQKASKDWFYNWDKAKEIETMKDGLEKPKETPKTTAKGGLDQYLKELDARNPIKASKAVGKQCEKGELTKTAPGGLSQYLKELDARNPIKDPKVIGEQREKGKTEKTAPGTKELTTLNGLSNTSKPANKRGFDQYWKKFETLNSIKEAQVKPARSVDSDPAPAPEGTSDENPPFTEFGDHIAGLIESTFKKFQSADSSIPSYKTLAGVVMTSGPKTNGSRVICVATGSKSISGRNLSLEGKSINDCHAEILARRGLVSFLYDQLEKYFIHPEESIFEPAWNARLRIKNHVLFHLYVSSAPCGSASEQGSSLQTKIEGIDGTVPVTEKSIYSSERFIFDDNLFTMSCTDKMTRWSVVGVQGSLLTHIINPIYFHTVVIGNRFHLDNLRSSLIERVEDLPGIPAPFVFVEPVLAGTTQLVLTAVKGSWIPISPVISVCWVNGWIQPERIESINGKLLEDESSSSLCKRTFFQRFTSLVSKNPEWSSLENGKFTYGSLKKSAKTFMQTNELLMASLLNGGFGHWVKKPEGQDHFEI